MITPTFVNFNLEEYKLMLIISTSNINQGLDYQNDR